MDGNSDEDSDPDILLCFYIHTAHKFCALQNFNTKFFARFFWEKKTSLGVLSPGQTQQTIQQTMFHFHVLQSSFRLATLFDDTFHVGQCSALFKNCLMEMKTFLELHNVLRMFVTLGHLVELFNEQMRFSNARMRIYETF